MANTLKGKNGIARMLRREGRTIKTEAPINSKLLLLLKLTIINTTIKKLILHSVVLDPLENAKIKSVPKTSQYYAIYTKTFKKYVQILRI